VTGAPYIAAMKATLSQATKPETRSFYAEMVQRVIDRIAADLDAALDLETLAKSAGLSPFHFHRVFRGMVGETPLELTRRLRMERAAWNLAHTIRPVTAIAFDAGYETHEAFTRAFRAEYGSPPSGFRQRATKRFHLTAPAGVHFDPAGGPQQFTPCDTGGRTMHVEIKDMPARRLATIRHVGPYMQIGKAFEQLGAIAGAAGLYKHPGAAMLALYHDDPEAVSPDQLRSDAGISVPEGVPLPAGLAEQRVAAGRYACTLHLGPYDRLPDTWARLMGEWLPASEHRLGSGASYEIYLNNPMNTPKEKLETEVCIPLA
jgi:AraC family transcriptional regulator